MWKKYFDGYEFKYFFLDENFARQYQSEQKLAKVFTTFSIVTILIASIGLVGLVSFMVVSKTKEIGIRKILGAGVFNITGMLSKEFMVLTLVANLIACPLAWYFMSKWLEKFAYRTTISLELFALTFIIGLVATFITVSFQTMRAAMADPVKSLRYE
jgi:putative ABC transport system permease protein